jgi:hypothetical protein
MIGASDDFGFEVGQGFGERGMELWSLVASIGKELLQERIHSEQGRKNQGAAVAILDIGGMNNGVKQQTHRVYENLALLSLDFFTRVIAMWIDASPPFSALFTLWLSMMAAVGLNASHHGPGEPPIQIPTSRAKERVTTRHVAVVSEFSK